MSEKNERIKKTRESEISFCYTYICVLCYMHVSGSDMKYTSYSVVQKIAGQWSVILKIPYSFFYYIFYK